jgi:predicted nucleic acid-binding protein
VKVLLDTNVVVAAFVARGRCSELFEHCALEHELVTSEPLSEELSGALRELELSERDVVHAVRLYRRRARLATPIVTSRLAGIPMTISFWQRLSAASVAASSPATKTSWSWVVFEASRSVGRVSSGSSS